MKFFLRTFAAAFSLMAAAIIPQTVHADEAPDDVTPAKKVAILIAGSNEDNLGDQEREALKIFKANYPEGTVFTLSNISDLNTDDYSALWYHLERNVYDNDATYFSETVRNALTTFVNAGGNLLLTKNAGCMLKYVVSDELDFDHYGFNNGGNGTANWTMNVAAFGDRSDHPIFKNCTINEDGEAKLISLLNINDKFLIDNNIGWNLNAEKRGGKDNFCSGYNAELLGTWGNHNENGWEQESAFMVEFKPTDARKGTVVFNGMSAFQLWVSDNSETDNAAYSNLSSLIAGAINYLGSVTNTENGGGNNEGGEGNEPGEGEDPGNSSGGGEDFVPLRTNAVAFLRLDDPSKCEEGAQDVFTECYPKGSVISAQQLIDNTEINDETGLYELTINGKHIEAVWIHVNRPDVNFWDEENGYVLPTELMSDDFTKALYNYSIDGGKMYLSGIATKLLVRIGRQKSEYAPSIKDDTTNGFDNQTRTYNENHGDSWGVTGKLSDAHHDGDGGWGMCMHAIYGITWDDYPGYFASLENYGNNGTAATDSGDKEFPTKVWILGAAEGTTLKHSNNNCMWDVTGDKNNWRYRNRAETLGTWDHQGCNTQSIGIVEFVPDIDTAHNGFNSDLYGEYPRKSEAQGASRRDDTNGNRPWLGNTIANGMAAFTYADNENNRYYNNLRNMTFNTINYLTQAYHEEHFEDNNVIDQPITSGIEEVAVEAENVAPVYYNLQGVRVENPQGGIFVKVQGSKVTKVAL